MAATLRSPVEADLPNLANVDYVDRINRAIDHITRNLAEPLPLEDVARVACFSPFHFHRIFRALVGETLLRFIKRVRLEHALHLMAHRKGASLTHIALACGFSSSSDFSRSFRAQFGVPPSAFDLDTYRDARRGQLVGFDGQRLDRLPAGENPDSFAVALRDLPARRVAYIRVTKPYEGTGVMDAYARMIEWATARGVAGGQWLGYQWEDPEIVALEHCRYDVGLEVAEDAAIEPGGEVGVVRFPAMRVAELDLAGPIALEMRAIDYVYRTWLPASGYVPDHQPGFEVWNGLPFAHGHEHFELRIHIPITGATTPV
jgi:AraC family transcriptional regulator